MKGISAVQAAVRTYVMLLLMSPQLDSVVAVCMTLSHSEDFEWWEGGIARPTVQNRTELNHPCPKPASNTGLLLERPKTTRYLQLAEFELATCMYTISVGWLVIIEGFWALWDNIYDCVYCFKFSRSS
jgi:hypothetical protein